MCTCGIDIATQHATPATHSSACSAPGDRPSGRDVSRAGAVDTALAPAADRRPATIGGRRRNTSASGSIVSTQNTPMPM